MFLYLIYFLFLIFDSSIVVLLSSPSFSASSSFSTHNLIKNGNAETGQLYPWETSKNGWKASCLSYFSGNYSFLIDFDTFHLKDENCCSYYAMYQPLILSLSEANYSLSFWARSIILNEKNNSILKFSIDAVEKKDVSFFSFSFHVDSSSTLYRFYSTNFTFSQDHNNLSFALSTCFPIEIDEISIFPHLPSSSSLLTVSPPHSSSPFNSNYNLSSSISGDHQLAGHQMPLNDSLKQ
jgi:hypothetical protein